MSESVEQIERLRHRLREMEQEARRSEQIRKSVAIECEIEESLENVDDERTMKQEIVRTWTADYNTDVQCILNNDAGDNSWLDVVGDVMDEMRQRVAEAQQGSVEKSEIDLRAILALIDDDVKNLGELCAELLAKFMSRRVAVEKEKHRRGKEVSEICDGPEDTKLAVTDGVNVVSLKECDSKLDGDESKDVKPRQETVVEQSMGDFESKEAKADENAAEQDPKENNAETVGDCGSKQTDDGNPELEEIPNENYIKFTIVDEKNRPLGVNAVSEAEGDGATTTATTNDQETGRPVTPENRDDGLCTPNVHCPSPTLESLASSPDQPINEPTTDEIWLQVANSIIDQNRSSDVASVNVYDLVNMLVTRGNENGSEF